MPAEVPIGRRRAQRGARVAARAGPRARRLLPDRPRPGRPHPPAPPAPPSTRARWSWSSGPRTSAPWAPRSPAPARTVLFWCHWQQTGALMERAAREAPDCELRRVQFAPAGADVQRARERDEVRRPAGVPVRDDGRVAARPPPQVRRLDAAQGQARPGRELRAGRAARGRGGDQPDLPARPRAQRRPTTATTRTARRSCATGRWRSSRGAVRAQRRGRRAPLARARRGRGQADLRARPGADRRSRQRVERRLRLIRDHRAAHQAEHQRGQHALQHAAAGRRRPTRSRPRRRQARIASSPLDMPPQNSRMRRG